MGSMNRPVVQETGNGQTETIESVVVKRETAPFYESAEREALPDDFAQEVFGIDGPMDQFSLSARTRHELGIGDDFSYTYVLDPDCDAAKRTGVNRERQIKDCYPGAEVVYDPETHAKVRCTDTVLMKIPVKYIQQREANLKVQADLFTRSNPVIARELGLTDAESRAAREKFDSQLADLQSFDPNDKEQRKRMIANAQRASLPYRNSTGSPTFNMTLDDAVESKIKAIGRTYNWDTRTVQGRRQAEKFYEEKYLPALTRKAMSQGRVSHRPSWSESLASARAMNGGGISMAVGFGKSAMEVLTEQRDGKRQQGRTTTRKKAK